MSRRRKIHTTVLFLISATLFFFLRPNGARYSWMGISKTWSPNSVDARAKAIRQAFIHGWRGYHKYAFPHDMLLPLSRSYSDFRAGWGEQVVDILPAAILMDIPEVVRASIDHINSIDWDVLGTDYPNVSVFGTTIRYLGALISGYDLLTSTHSEFAKVNGFSQAEIAQLLVQAQQLANSLSPAFDTPTKIFHNQLTFPDHRITPGTIADITSTSGIALEWSRLSAITGNKTYSDLALASLKPLLSPQSNGSMTYPGLLPKFINTDSGEFIPPYVGGWSHAGGGLYEMLAKLTAYDSASKRFSACLDHWKVAADSSMEYLASHPLHRPDLTFLADFNTSTGDSLYYGDHSGMFAAASFLLGGSLTGEQRYINFGLELVNSYVTFYQSTPTGFGPESWGWIPDWCADGPESTEALYPTYVQACFVDDPSKLTFARRHGWYPIDKTYKLRPEVVESLYYAYRITKNPKYRDLSYEIFQKLIKHCKNDIAFAELQDIGILPARNKNYGRGDGMHSWVLSETFFYIWAAHVDDAPWQVDSHGNNEWVFTTQAHPIRVESLASS